MLYNRHTQTRSYLLSKFPKKPLVQIETTTASNLIYTPYNSNYTQGCNIFNKQHIPYMPTNHRFTKWLYFRKGYCLFLIQT